MALKTWHKKGHANSTQTNKKGADPATTFFVESFLLACCQHKRDNAATQETGKLYVEYGFYGNLIIINVWKYNLII